MKLGDVYDGWRHADSAWGRLAFFGGGRRIWMKGTLLRRVVFVGVLRIWRLGLWDVERCNGWLLAPSPRWLGIASSETFVTCRRRS